MTIIAMALHGLPSESHHDIRRELFCVLLHNLHDIRIFLDAQVLDSLEQVFLVNFILEEELIGHVCVLQHRFHGKIEWVALLKFDIEGFHTLKLQILGEDEHFLDLLSVRQTLSYLLVLFWCSFILDLLHRGKESTLVLRRRHVHLLCILEVELI